MYLEKVDEDGNIVRWKGKHINIAKKNDFVFIHECIINSGVPLSKLTKYKAQDVVELFLKNEEWCNFKEEDLVGYRIKPFQNLFKRCVGYEDITFSDVYKLRKVSDKFDYFFKNLATPEDFINIYTNDVFWDHYTDAMKRVVYMSSTLDTLADILREVEPEEWTTHYGKETEEERATFDRNNRLMFAFTKICELKVVSARYWEAFMTFYDKFAEIYMNRVNRDSRFMCYTGFIIDFFRNCERNIYSKICTTLSGQTTLYPVLGKNSWSSIRLFGYYETDTVAEFKRYINRFDSKEKAMQDLEQLKYFGLKRRHNGCRKGVGMKRTYAQRLKFWQPI